MSYDLDAVLLMGAKANQYARERIIKGTTQIENNQLSQEYCQFLKHGMGLCGLFGVRTFIDQYVCEQLREEPLMPITLIYFEAQVLISEKYSLGNCQEMTLQALRYLLDNDTKMNAEVFEINGGDHCYLVLNRDQNSEVARPSTWGVGAVICDPWGNKVYPANQFIKELKNYYEEDKKNYIEDFTYSKHEIALHKNKYSAARIRKYRQIDTLRERFHCKAIKLINVLMGCKKKLMNEHDRLVKIYDENDIKVKILNLKINSIQFQIEKIDNVNNSIKANQQTRASINREYVKLINDVFSVIRFSEDEANALFEIRGQGVTQKVMRFFGIPSTTQSHLQCLQSKTEMAVVKLI